MTQPDLRCYYHPEREADGQCEECGDYLCAECIRKDVVGSICSTCLRIRIGGFEHRSARAVCLLNLVSVAVCAPIPCLTVFAPVGLVMALLGSLSLRRDDEDALKGFYTANALISATWLVVFIGAFIAWFVDHRVGLRLAAPALLLSFWAMIVLGTMPVRAVRPGWMIPLSWMMAGCGFVAALAIVAVIFLNW